MHLVTAHQWAGYVLKPIQLECPDPPAAFDNFLRYNGFRNGETYHLGEASPAPSDDSAANISLGVYQADTTREFEPGPKFLVSLDIADTNALVLLDSPGEYASFLNTYSPRWSFHCCAPSKEKRVSWQHISRTREGRPRLDHSALRIERSGFDNLEVSESALAT